jgi:hypothetical protein
MQTRIKGLSEWETSLAWAILNAMAEGPFISDYDLPLVTGFKRIQLQALHQRRNEITDNDDDAISAVGQCLNNCLSYPHNKYGELERWTGASMFQIRTLVEKWFGPGTGTARDYFDRLA